MSTQHRTTANPDGIPARRLVRRYNRAHGRTWLTRLTLTAGVLAFAPAALVAAPVISVAGEQPAAVAEAISFGGQVWNKNTNASILIVSERGTAELWAGATSRQYHHSDVNYVQARAYECIQMRDYGTTTWRKATTYSGQRVGLGNTARKEVRTVMRTGVC